MGAGEAVAGSTASALEVPGLSPTLVKYVTRARRAAQTAFLRGRLHANAFVPPPRLPGARASRRRALETYLSAGATLVEFGTAAVRTDLAVHCRLISIAESDKVAAQPKPTVNSFAPHRLVVAPLADVPGSNCLSGGARPLAQHTKWCDRFATPRAHAAAIPPARRVHP